MRLTLLIPTVLFIVLGGYGWWWHSKATTLESLARENINELNAQFTKQGGWMAVKYTELETSNFPSAPHITLVKPCLHYNQPSMRVLDLCAARVDISAENFSLTSFTIHLPKRASGQEFLQNGLFHTYVLEVDEAPEISVRLPAAEREETPAPAALASFNKPTPTAQLDALPATLIHQYALHLPEKVQVSVEQDKKPARYADANLPRSPIVIWRKATYKLDYLTDLLFHYMAEVAENGMKSPKPN